MGGNGIGQPAGVVDAGDGCENFWWNFLVQFDVLVKLLHHCPAQGLDLTGLGADRAFWLIRDGHRRQLGRKV